MAISNLLTANEVAEILQVSPRTLASWRSKYPDDLPFVKVGGLVRYRDSDVEDYIDSQDFGSSNDDYDDED